MKISVVIPTWNREGCIKRAINSCKGADEIVVINDGSTDNTHEILCGRKDINYYWLPKNYGVNTARSVGVRIAKGDYIIFLDSDDELTIGAIDFIRKQKLEKINFFKTEDGMNGIEMSNLEKKGVCDYKDWLEDKTTGEFLGVYNKSVFKNNLFNPKLFCFEMIWVTKTIKKAGKYKTFNKTLRMYDSTQNNRMTKELSKLSKAREKYEGYCEYYDLIIEDLRNYKLDKKKAILVLKILFYKFLGWVW